MKFILGKKLNMTELFDENGKVYPATVVETGPLTVTQIKTEAVDGYDAVQVGYGVTKEKRVNKAQIGHTKDLGHFQYFREFPGLLDHKVGDKLDVDSFKEGDSVVVVAISKGKGFQGVIKRHGFKGGPRSHGQKHSEREPGSIGGGLRNKVPKNMRMAGRMGSDKISVKGLKVLHIDKEAGKIYISGAIPGRRGTLVDIRG